MTAEASEILAMTVWNCLHDNVPRASKGGVRMEEVSYLCRPGLNGIAQTLPKSLAIYTNGMPPNQSTYMQNKRHAVANGVQAGIGIGIGLGTMHWYPANSICTGNRAGIFCH